MNKKFLFTIFSLSLMCVVCQASDDGNCDLQIYMPREITVSDSCLKLGQLAIVRGEESIVARASEISLGKISMPGQKVVIDRAVLLGRLACNKIDCSKVKLTGAEKITVSRQQKIIKADEFVELANAFLKEKKTANSTCSFELVRTPKDLLIETADEKIQMQPSLMQSQTASEVNVQIMVINEDGSTIAKRKVSFRPKYQVRKAIAVIDIAAGEIINENNIKIEKAISNYPQSAGWKPPYGLIAKRPLAAKTIINPNTVRLPQPEIIVKRNQNVVIRAQSPGILITAIGKALQKGRVGDCIKVRNVDSKRIITGKISEDGAVEAVF
ncbi:MAG: flagellar basal body P-ring formation protein FlgA [Planctomycetes bacterium]|nr:flagellar basal body P-ring formation protein FlgA [Planctomycetota bacterium]MCK5473275.1 flagellar basal body P-ring formation protein FlgA [Planctomycetota bacterium]